jgi:protease-4
MSFLKAFFASCLGTLVALVLLFFITIAFFGSLSTEQEVKVAENSVLQINLNTVINELEVEDPLAELFPNSIPQNVGLIQLTESIREAKDDANIRGIYLQAGSPFAGYATLEEIRAALQDFRTSGKWVIAYADNYSEAGYYLASVADQVYMSPNGLVEFNGLSIEVNFFKKLFDKLEIKPQVFRVGDFKSAIEPFVREELSEENRMQLNSIIQSIHGVLLQQVAESRNRTYAELKTVADDMLVRNAQQALEQRLVDSLFYHDQLRATLAQRVGTDPDDIELIAYAKYRKTYSTYSSSKNEVAVIVAEGEIVPGTSDENTVIASTTFREEIRKARTNNRIKAIVIRVNSPGGVFQAADEMWREIQLAAQEKPVIASMGDYAASGGYYLAMACDTIVARPTTITGSIGVFSVLFDLSSFLDNKLGITSDQVQTGNVGDLITVTRPLTDLERQIWQKQTDEIYEIFTGKAAAGRGMKQEDLKKIASGRVWTGLQAVENHLADQTGGLQDAIAVAARQAGVSEDYKVKYYPKTKSLLERFMNTTEETVQAKVLQHQLGDHFSTYQHWQRLKTYQGTQARMGVEFGVK